MGTRRDRSSERVPAPEAYTAVLRMMFLRAAAKEFPDLLNSLADGPGAVYRRFKPGGGPPTFDIDETNLQGLGSSLPTPEVEMLSALCAWAHLWHLGERATYSPQTHEPDPWVLKFADNTLRWWVGPGSHPRIPIWVMPSIRLVYTYEHVDPWIPNEWMQAIGLTDRRSSRPQHLSDEVAKFKQWLKRETAWQSRSLSRRATKDIWFEWLALRVIDPDTWSINALASERSPGGEWATVSNGLKTLAPLIGIALPAASKKAPATRATGSRKAQRKTPPLRLA